MYQPKKMDFITIEDLDVYEPVLALILIIGF